MSFMNVMYIFLLAIYLGVKFGGNRTCIHLTLLATPKHFQNSTYLHPHPCE